MEMLEYLIIYYIVGWLVAITMYSGSSLYKFQHKDYISRGKKFGKILGFIAIPILWSLFIGFMGYGVVLEVHNRQELKVIIGNMETMIEERNKEEIK
jgi:hypothetical protein